jgi:hypothetical protein
VHRLPFMSLFTFVGTTSTICSGLVVLTVLIFPTMLKRKMFMQIMTMSAIADMIANIFIALGFPNGETCILVREVLSFFFLLSLFKRRFLPFSTYLTSYSKSKAGLFTSF